MIADKAKHLTDAMAGAGIPIREVRVYGSQAHFDCSRANAARAKSIMVDGGFKFRAEVGDAWKLSGERRRGVTLYFVVA